MGAAPKSEPSFSFDVWTNVTTGVFSVYSGVSAMVTTPGAREREYAPRIPWRCVEEWNPYAGGVAIAVLVGNR